MGVERALAAFVDLLEEPGQPTLPRRFYVELGRGELRQGRGLDALLSAYRVGARVAWRTVGDLAVEAGASPAVLVELAELLFTYIDGLSALSVRGYAEEQAARAGERDRRRAELARLLVTGHRRGDAARACGPGPLAAARASGRGDPSAAQAPDRPAAVGCADLATR